MRGKKKSLFFSASFTFSLPLFFTCTPKRHNTKKKHPTRVPPRWRKMQKNVLTQSLDLWTSSLLKIRSTTELCERAFAQFYFLELHKQRTLVRKERKRKPDFDSLSPSQPRFLSPLFSRLPLSPKSPCSPPPHALLARRGKQLAISYPCFSLPLSLLLSVLECRLSIASSSSSPPHSLSFYPLPLSRPPRHAPPKPPPDAGNCPRSSIHVGSLAPRRGAAAGGAARRDCQSIVGHGVDVVAKASVSPVSGLP